ncbi:piggyBac transposable element-derived protein 4-like [Betta splendens]|uniref:PiggyBac transposable element-derived protein 4-like n=1 Tax=Betta splendens TaxID=158456 RepID=A0A6P7N9Q0_BETSP|nr:piggyBac transposable element-derived protein 4-like [Betta splendens]
MPARTPGPTFDAMKSWSPLSLFQLFFSALVIQKIVDNTNANAAKRVKAGMAYKWQTLKTRDFYIFISIIIFTGLVNLHHRSDYWRQQFPYNFSFPSKKMSRNRFKAIMWSLHLSDPDEDEENENKRISGGHDMLFKIKPLYSELVKACKTNFQPSQNISIDEQMVASKTPVSVKPYLKGKSTKWGYKLFVLADSSTGYTWNFFVDTGKKQSSTTTTNGLSYSYVMDLLPLQTLGTGYRLYIDNLYTSTTVFTDLYKKKIGCCGMTSTSCIGFPQTQINDLAKKVEKGDIRWIRRDDLLFVNWMDIKKETMCFTIHKAYSNQTIRRNVNEAGVWTNKLIPAPDSILDHNKIVGGLDLSNKLLGFYAVGHKTKKWFKTFFSTSWTLLW